MAALMLGGPVLAYGYAGSIRAKSGRRRIAADSGLHRYHASAGPRSAVRMHRQYAGLSQEAVDRYGQVDLIVWPETVLGDMLLTAERDA